MNLLRLPLLIALGCFTMQAQAGPALIIVQDLGGASALPYYEPINAEPQASGPTAPMTNVTAAMGFPVQTAALTPARFASRIINSPGLQPFFLVGDDELSRQWLQARRTALQQMQVPGIAVNVESAERLAAIRGWAGGLSISPAPGDDLAQRLGIEHYPALITPTAIEQ